MTRKQKVADFIINNPNASFDDWAKFQQECVPEIRLKKVGKGHVQINLDGSSGFFDPASWLLNHKAGLRSRCVQALSEMEGIFTKEEFSSILSDYLNAGVDHIRELTQNVQALQERIVTDNEVAKATAKMLVERGAPSEWARYTIAFLLLYRRNVKPGEDLDTIKSRVNSALST
jgi:hypothetical protein